LSLLTFAAAKPFYASSKTNYSIIYRLFISAIILSFFASSFLGSHGSSPILIAFMLIGWSLSFVEGKDLSGTRFLSASLVFVLMGTALSSFKVSTLAYGESLIEVFFAVASVNYIPLVAWPLLFLLLFFLVKTSTSPNSALIIALYILSVSILLY